MTIYSNIDKLYDGIHGAHDIHGADIHDIHDIHDALTNVYYLFILCDFLTTCLST